MQWLLGGSQGLARSRLRSREAGRSARWAGHRGTSARARAGYSVVLSVCLPLAALGRTRTTPLCILAGAQL